MLTPVEASTGDLVRSFKEDEDLKDKKAIEVSIESV